jgi:cytochrome oxidase Cu insertion factor (SCO1/SenC/PrrC family)
MASATAMALLAAALAEAQNQTRPAPATGLQIGAKAPGFTLKDHNGTERSLDEFLVKGKVALVFYRSADW